MQIHHSHTTYEDRWVLDPDKGSVKRREALMQPSGTSAISVPAGRFESCPDGETFTATDDTFNVPEDVAAYFLNMPGWGEGLSPFPPEDLAVSDAPTRGRKKAS